MRTEQAMKCLRKTLEIKINLDWYKCKTDTESNLVCMYTLVNFHADGKNPVGNIV